MTAGCSLSVCVNIPGYIYQHVAYQYDTADLNSGIRQLKLVSHGNALTTYTLQSYCRPLRSKQLFPYTQHVPRSFLGHRLNFTSAQNYRSFMGNLSQEQSCRTDDTVNRGLPAKTPYLVIKWSEDKSLVTMSIDAHHHHDHTSVIKPRCDVLAGNPSYRSSRMFVSARGSGVTDCCSIIYHRPSLITCT